MLEIKSTFLTRKRRYSSRRDGFENLSDKKRVSHSTKVLTIKKSVEIVEKKNSLRMAFFKTREDRNIKRHYALTVPTDLSRQKRDRRQNGRRSHLSAGDVTATAKYEICKLRHVIDSRWRLTAENCLFELRTKTVSRNEDVAACHFLARKKLEHCVKSAALVRCLVRQSILRTIGNYSFSLIFDSCAAAHRALLPTTG